MSGSFFSKSQNTVVNGDQFIDARVNAFQSDGSNGKHVRMFKFRDPGLKQRYTNPVPHTLSFAGIDILLDASAPDAVVDAEARKYAPSCFPGTREQYIADITRWATSSGDGPLMFWMKGPAGVGKSAIAQTCAETLKTHGQLGAAFFFSINGCDDHKRLFVTLAYQLSTVLPEYKKRLNNSVLNDKTVVKKTISSQFDALIVQPLQGLGERELAEVGKRAILIDGLDECKNKDAQSEIIEIIAVSVQAQITPFRWAFFSRPEANIERAFASHSTSPFCRVASLPISREIDCEIRLYLKGGFKNILRRRNHFIPSPWPSEEVIQKLVDASEGFYAYPAAALRFIENYPAGLDEALGAVLSAIVQPGGSITISPFAQLDALYMLIIPEHMLPAAQLVLAHMSEDAADSYWSVAFLCTKLGLSESDFKTVTCNLLPAVVYYRRNSETFRFNEAADVNRPYYDQPDQSIRFDAWLHGQISQALGCVGFYHKSFYDFLADPTRSGTFCATAPLVRQELVDRYSEIHLKIARSYVIQDSCLLLAPGVANAAASLPWPLPNELTNTLLKDTAFNELTEYLLHGYHAQGLQQGSPEKLAELDYPKALMISARHKRFMSWRAFAIRGLFSESNSVNVTGCTDFRRLSSSVFEEFDPAEFLAMICRYEKLGIIKAYRPTFGSRMKSLTRRLRTGAQCSGLYVLGQGDKSVLWYWELDDDLRYYLEFATLDLAQALVLYQKEKSELVPESVEVRKGGVSLLAAIGIPFITRIATGIAKSLQNHFSDYVVITPGHTSDLFTTAAAFTFLVIGTHVSAPQLLPICFLSFISSMFSVLLESLFPPLQPLPWLISLTLYSSSPFLFPYLLEEFSGRVMLQDPLYFWAEAVIFAMACLQEAGIRLTENSNTEAYIIMPLVTLFSVVSLRRFRLEATAFAPIFLTSVWGALWGSWHMCITSTSTDEPIESIELKLQKLNEASRTLMNTLERQMEWYAEEAERLLADITRYLGDFDRCIRIVNFYMNTMPNRHQIDPSRYQRIRDLCKDILT